MACGRFSRVPTTPTVNGTPRSRSNCHLANRASRSASLTSVGWYVVHRASFPLTPPGPPSPTEGRGGEQDRSGSPSPLRGRGGGGGEGGSESTNAATSN